MDAELCRPLDLVVVAISAGVLRCRIVGSERAVTLHAPGDGVVPGEVISVGRHRSWTLGEQVHVAGQPYASRLDVSALSVAPLELRPAFDWDPDLESWIDDDAIAADWVDGIANRGPRPAFEMEQVRARTNPDDPDEDALEDARKLKQVGAFEAARALLMGVLSEDLRCLAVHAQLGDFELDARPDRALRHYNVGVAIAELSLGTKFDGVLPWTLTGNRPFLRCLHGVGLCLWRLGRNVEAAKVFNRMLWLNPADNFGERFNLEALQQALSWDEVQRRLLQ